MSEKPQWALIKLTGTQAKWLLQAIYLLYNHVEETHKPAVAEVVAAVEKMVKDIPW